ncbi:MAG: hypothetical protein EBZ50_01505 [Alphaproteobacteria bacterium]|nr:hypothetical protein [Alphaproteobacteria bacterium]
MLSLPENLRALQGPIAGGLLLVVMGAVGVAWLSIAAVESAAAVLGHAWAPAIVGLLLVAPLVVLAAMAWAKARKRDTAPRLVADGAETALSAIAAAAQNMVEKSPLTALALATLAGVMATLYPAGLAMLVNVFGINDRGATTPNTRTH